MKRIFQRLVHLRRTFLQQDWSTSTSLSFQPLNKVGIPTPFYKSKTGKSDEKRKRGITMTTRIEPDPAKRKAIAAEMNLSVLKRADSSIRSVLSSATHVAMYQLVEDDQRWIRCDIEGALFIVERDIHHVNNADHIQYRIVIINRKSLNNYTDDIIVGNKDIELSDDGKTIMYCNSKGITVGIWFYLKDEAKFIFDMFMQIATGTVKSPKRPTPTSLKQQHLNSNNLAKVTITTDPATSAPVATSIVSPSPVGITAQSQPISAASTTSSIKAVTSNSLPTPTSTNTKNVTASQSTAATATAAATAATTSTTTATTATTATASTTNTTTAASKTTKDASNYETEKGNNNSASNANESNGQIDELNVTQLQQQSPPPPPPPRVQLSMGVPQQPPVTFNGRVEFHRGAVNEVGGMHAAEAMRKQAQLDEVSRYMHHQQQQQQQQHQQQQMHFHQPLMRLPGPGPPGIGLPPSPLHHHPHHPHPHPHMAMLMQQRQQQDHQLMIQQMMIQQQRAMGMGGNGMNGRGGMLNGDGVDLRQENGGSLNGGNGVPISMPSILEEEERKEKSREIENGVGAAIAMAQRNGLGGGDKDKMVSMNRDEFRTILQRSLNDRKLFETVYGHYINKCTSTTT